MNTYKTPEDGQSYQKIQQIRVKKILQHGTYFGDERITNQELQNASKKCSNKQEEDLENNFMDAKWNNIVDNTMVRIAMVVVGFGAWFAIGYSLLAA